MSTPTRWVRVRELFDTALEQPTESRESWVRQAAGHETALGEEVLSLLGALEHARATLERPAASVMADSFADTDEALLVGRRVGAYDIVRLLGYGGMGAVYEAVRADGDFSHRVAIKFLRPGMGSDLALRRFRYERQILATFNHRNIAGLFDGGVTEDGHPYFVMEYVEGTPITTYCGTRALSVRERVSLFRQVCAAVQHAHQQLVVHRDLKPGNILVSDDGTVKLLDFGIAKLLRAEEGPDQLPMTRGGVRVFTPEYASPEQVRGLALAPASDIYSLGVILYELLAGRRPFSTDGKLLAEIEREICTVPPTRPSALLEPREGVVYGDGSLERVRRRIAGDLDAIVLTALAKEAALRYGTAEQLAADLRRWLEGHPVTARKTWLGYRMRKFAGRHRFEVAASAITVIALAAGMFATLRQARIAETEAAKTAQVNAFISTMLSAVDPGYQGRDVTVAQVLSQAARDVEQQRLDPEVEAQIRHTLGQTYYGLGLYDSAAAHAQRAYDLRRQQFGLVDRRTGQSLSYVVALAEARGAYAEAESLARVGVEIQRRMPVTDDEELASAIGNLARMLTHQGRLDEAMTLNREAVSTRRRSSDSVAVAGLTFDLNNLAVAHSYRGEYAAAESLQREALAIEARNRGTSTPGYGDLLRGLSGVLEDLGRLQEADSVMRESVRLLKLHLGEDHANYLRAAANLARLRMSLGDLQGAIAISSDVASRIGRGLPEGDQTSAVVLQILGIALDSVGRYEDGGVALQRSLDLRRKYLGPDHWATFNSVAALGVHRLRLRQYDDAERLLLEGYRGVSTARGETSLPARETAKRLMLLYERTNRPGEAASWRKKSVPSG